MDGKPSTGPDPVDVQHNHAWRVVGVMESEYRTIARPNMSISWSLFFGLLANLAVGLEEPTSSPPPFWAN